jgi:DNA repair exonuclease SbcCD nuclease subunit
MPRLAFVTDIHIDETKRFMEQERVLEFVACDATVRGCDALLEGGDLYERKSTPIERLLASRWTQWVTASMPMVRIRGNHDAPRDLELLAELDTAHECITEEAAGVHVVGPFVVGCLSWPSKASILALAQDRGYSHAEGEAVAGAALRAVLLGLGAEMDAVKEARGMHSAPKVLLMHAMVRASRVSTGQPLTGCDLEVGLDDLKLARADFYALGHVHMPQEWTEGDATIVYGGSPRRTTYGEVEEKSYVVADFCDATGRLLKWERVPTPCAPMVLLEGEWDGDFLRGATWASEAMRGAEVRLRYRVASDQREMARAYAAAQAELLRTAGAADVQIEERVIATSEARAPEVAAAKTLPDKLAAMWAARDVTPDPERRDALFTMVTDLETAERAA